MRNIALSVDFCVVGGGMAGLSAAVAAARRGAKVALIQNRPVLGGNASSEVRMWICGAHNENNHETGRVDPEGGDNNHETGIIEEILLENLWRNTYPNYSIWDSILYEKARFQENLELFLNTHVTKVEVEADGHGRRILSVEGTQMTTESRVVVTSKLFADCTGDGLVGALAGAEYRVGREARSEFGESIAPVQPDKRTMGLSCLIQARETGRLQGFTPPAWAYRYDSDEDLPKRGHRVEGIQNFWWMEVGGMQDSIHDTEEIRDELLKIAFGVWDHIKNHGDHGADNWALDWVGFLPGKRESRRFVGDHILNQNDVEKAGRHFRDIVAYGGWTMDDHFPEGFYKKEAGTIFNAAPAPYGIPYRSLYSRNIDNLFFAGRDISTTHCALSSTRVMATCSTLGQAVGTAAAIALHAGLTPRGVYEEAIEELQQTLMEDDCYLPFNQRRINAITREARLLASRGNPELLRNGIDRQIGTERNSWDAMPGDSVIFDLGSEVELKAIRLVFDSDLNRTTRNMVSYYTMASQDFRVPPQLVKSFTIEIEAGTAGSGWKQAISVKDNHQRLVKLPLGVRASRLRFTALETWGAPEVRVFALDLY